MSAAYKPVDIFLVEDNPNDVELTLRAFKKAQVHNEIVVARDGQEALDYLQSCLTDPEKRLPGIVLLDLNLPRVSGHEVLKAMKADPNLARIPVVVLTASTREQDVLRSYDLGVSTFISKPVEFEAFMKVVATIQDYWIIIATLPTSIIETAVVAEQTA